MNELTPILGIKEVTSNTDLLGKYTEAAIRGLVHRIVQPMRVCTGAVLDYPLPTKLRQIDLIIWAPFPAPAVFEVEGFGLVPRSSAFGVIEVKRSNYGTDVDESLEGFLADVDARKIVADLGGPMRAYGVFPGLGIVSVLEGNPSSRLRVMMEAKKAIAIFKRDGETVSVQPRDVWELVNWLHRITWLYRVQSSAPDCIQIHTSSLD